MVQSTNCFFERVKGWQGAFHWTMAREKMNIYRNSRKHGPDGMSSVEIFQHCSDIGSSVIITGGSFCSSALYFLYLEYIFLSVWIPYGDSILQLGAYQSVVGSLSHPGEFCFYISFQNAQGNSVYAGIPRQASRDVNPQVSSAGHSLHDLSM